MVRDTKMGSLILRRDEEEDHDREGAGAGGRRRLKECSPFYRVCCWVSTIPRKTSDEIRVTGMAGRSKR